MALHAARSEVTSLTVSQLNKQAKRLLESHFDYIWVEGEISNLAQPSSGHWYFSLKDSGAQVRCAMFRNRNQLVKIKPENGQQVRIRCRVSLYEGRGDFQLIVEFIEAAGAGALQAAFDQLKNRLGHEGLFDADRKQPLPLNCRNVGVITLTSAYYPLLSKVPIQGSAFLLLLSEQIACIAVKRYILMYLLLAVEEAP